MYYAEHGVPHFHAIYAGEDASIAIETLEILAGSLPDRALRLVREWARLNGDELRLNWQRARENGRSNRSHHCRRIGSMAGLVHVTSVDEPGPHQLRLTFEDGTEGEVDLSDRAWRGVLEPLADPAYFARVKLDAELGTIVWPNGVDIALEPVHAWVHGRAELGLSCEESARSRPRTTPVMCRALAPAGLR